MDGTAVLSLSNICFHKAGDSYSSMLSFTSKSLKLDKLAPMKSDPQKPFLCKQVVESSEHRGGKHLVMDVDNILLHSRILNISLNIV